jgi:phosphoribosylglycinamide formyltransferase-1
MSCRIVILISGSGSNLQALIDAQQNDQLSGGRIVGVLSNRADAGGIDRAKRAQIPTAVLSQATFEQRTDYDQALLEIIARWSPDLIVLAGFMRVLSSTFVTPWLGRLINIHPSLLPAFTGLDTHARAIAAGENRHGASVHFVTEALDGGPLIAYGEVPIMEDDSPKRLANRVLAVEHKIYPKVVALFAQNRLGFVEQGVTLDGKLIPKQGLCWNEGELV